MSALKFNLIQLLIQGLPVSFGETCTVCQLQTDVWHVFALTDAAEALKQSKGLSDMAFTEYTGYDERVFDSCASPLSCSLITFTSVPTELTENSKPT